MSKNSINIAIGFNIFLEHLLSYSEVKEKGETTKPPIVQLGGGAFNIAKTLSTLGMPANNVNLLGLVARNESPQLQSLHFLLNQEGTIPHLLALKERISSSYYLMPQKGETWAFGDKGGKLSSPGPREKKKITHLSKTAQIKIITELTINELALAKLFFKKYKKEQINTLIPSESLLKLREAGNVLKTIDFLSLNRQEAELLFKGGVTKDNALNYPIPYLLITDGPGEAWLKINNRLYTAKPKKINNPRFIGGAGDTATAALIYKLFVLKERPDKALKFAMEIGRKTVQILTSYYV